MRMPGDVVFSAGALLMAWDFIVKLRRPRGMPVEGKPGVEMRA
jgi:hypothetical protein